MHRIEHIELDITGDTTSLGGRLEEEIQKLGRPGFWEPLETVFDACAGPDIVWQIDELSIDLNIRADGDWQRVLQEQIRKQVEQYLLAHTTSPARRSALSAKTLPGSATEKERAIRGLSSTQKVLEDFLFYLLQGVVPWTVDAESFTAEYMERELLPALQQYPELWKDFVRRHRSWAASVSRRLSIHCPVTVYTLLLDILVPNRADALLATGEVWIKQVRRAGFSTPVTLLREVFRQELSYVVLYTWPSLQVEKESLTTVARQWLTEIIRFNSSQSAARIIGMLRQLSLQVTPADAEIAHLLQQTAEALLAETFPAETVTIGEAQQPDRKKQESPPARQEKDVVAGYEVTQAGMILLYPYMRPFFARMGLVDTKGQFQDETARQQAVYWWHYLASGDKEWPEPVYVLGKVLCGMEPSAVLQHRPDWKEDDLEEGNGLLEALIAHWEVLRNCSVSALRETFLIRKGHLSQRGGEWWLSVENSGVDVLLDHLPFPLSQAYLPWLERPVRVEWI